jgi:hypothetical protein
MLASHHLEPFLAAAAARTDWSDLDLAIAALACLGLIAGAVRGLLVSAGMLISLAIAVWVASRAAQLLLTGGALAPQHALVTAGVALAVAMLVAVILELVASALKDRLRGITGRVLDSTLGAACGAVVVLGMVWLGAAAVMSSPELRPLRPHITGSRVIAELNRRLPPSSALLQALRRHDPLPQIIGRIPQLAPPPPRLGSDPDIRRVGKSVARIEGTACGFRTTGSGWIARSGVIVTNAHVVAGHDSTTVTFVDGGREQARVVHLDSRRDVAVLRVPTGGRDPIALSPSPSAGLAAAVVGYPEAGPLTARPARYAGERFAVADDIYGRPAPRTIAMFRGDVRPGNSGGPLLDSSGRVIATVFASAVGGQPGGYAVPNDAVQDALASASDRAVSTGPCTSR